MLEAIRQDVRYGFRMLLRNPGFTLVTVATLALGIGANTVIFSVVNAILLRPLPFKDSERLVTVWHKYPSLDMPQAKVSVPGFIDYKDQANAFESMSALVTFSGNLTGQNEPERLSGIAVSADFFQTMGFDVAQGRSFVPEEGQPGQDQVVVLSNGLWKRVYGSSADVIGSNITFNEKSYTVVGIAPAGINLLDKVDIIAPLALAPQSSEKQRRVEYLNVIARLKPGFSIQQAQSEMDAIANRLRPQHYGGTDPALWGINLLPLYDQLVGHVRPSLLILQFTVALVLLITCANVASLLLARSTSRQREIGIRTALGATRQRLVRQLLTESMLMALLGGIGGLLLTSWGVKLVLAGMLRDNTQTLQLDLQRLDIPIDGRVLLFTLGFSLLTGAIFGLVPTLKVSRQNLNEIIKEGGGRSISSAGHHRVRNSLVVSEIALAVTLLIGAGLLVRSFLQLQTLSPGFRTENVLALSLNLPKTTYPEPTQVKGFYEQLLQKIGELPGIESVGAVSHLPMSGSDMKAHVKLAQTPDAIHSHVRIATPDYFHALGIRLSKGRTFSPLDNDDNRKVVIIDETLANTFFPNEDPVGKELIYQEPREIVGVVGNVKHGGLDVKSKFQIYLPFAQNPTNAMSIIVNGASDPVHLLPAIRNSVRAIDKDQPIYNIKTMEEALDGSLARQRGFMQLMTAMAILALMLAAMGIYGLISYSIVQRTHEIGIRMALGARPLDVHKMIVRQGAKLSIIGIVIGLAVSFALTRFLASLLFGVTAMDAATFAAISLLFMGVALAASYLPARRATKVDPVVVLRYE